MRTLLFLVAGLLLLSAFLLLGKLFSANVADAPRMATLSFVVLWLAIAAGNMWVGVAKAGYSVTEELPVFLLVFGLPTAAAVLLKWRFL